ncbi:transketolase family protein [Diaphorobacter aerolatus]|uniref:Transketolase n=1 Tax=Diaphorobacter aerolatus TaxID=1288495 RepID=A0A7H0GMH7_9BURK|nr:transketolase C-terminal domain-containing protein [Diaphorobacter aerolatus]QNP49493.1 transketolase [Diaphorobacter aerolatus]
MNTPTSSQQVRERMLAVEDFTQGGAHTSVIAAPSLEKPLGDGVPRYYGEALQALARERTGIVALSADLTAPTETDLFRDTFPRRFLNAGIAEANMMGVAGGLARSGMQAWVHTFCVFATRRAYDQVAMQIAYPHADVKIVGFLPGLSTILGVSHQAIDDVALMRALPHMTVIEPSGPAQIPAAVRAAADHEGPVYLRLLRASAALAPDTPWEPLELGRIQALDDRDGDVLIVASGLTVEPARAAALALREQHGIRVAVANAHTLKPFDADFVLAQARRRKLIVTVENHSTLGGLGSATAEVLAEAGSGVRLLRLGVRDRFAQGASMQWLFERHGLTATGIADAVGSALG